MVRPESSKRWLTVQDLVETQGLSERTARRRVTEWFSRQAAQTVPRVERATRECGGREYRIDRESYERFCAGELTASTPEVSLAA